MAGTKQRNACSKSALEQSPDYPPALWQNGYVLDRKKWRKIDDPDACLADSVRLAAYQRKREKTPDTIEGHMALAGWCAKRRMMDQRRAHLTRVLQIDPDHTAARGQLGLSSGRRELDFCQGDGRCTATRPEYCRRDAALAT